MEKNLNLLLCDQVINYKKTTSDFVYFIYLSWVTLHDKTRSSKNKIKLMDMFNLECQGYSEFLGNFNSFQISLR